jgi:16S rRNA (guanine527-N7)-methyltransferase
MSGESGAAGLRLNTLLAEAGLAAVDGGAAERFEAYLSLFVRWNARVNLSAIRDEEGILSRHFVESIACARALPAGIRTWLPGIPIALCRPEIAVTLAESHGKKAAFLEEAVRVLGISAKVHAGRAEVLHIVFDCVVLRAVDRMAEAVKSGAALVAPEGWLALMTTADRDAALRTAAGPELAWEAPMPLPGATDRILLLGKRINS